MNGRSIDRDRVELLAAKFIDALREGREPTIEQYVTENPDHAAEIRDLFPTIIAMECLKTNQKSGSPTMAKMEPTDIERLGDLRMIREIGRGGMGVVYEAEQESLGRRVAVKVLPKQRLNSEKSLARFLRESKTAAKLHHTNIVSVLGVGADEGYHYYVMQYIRGVGLDEVIRHLRGPESTVDRPASTVRPANLSAVAAELLNQTASDDGPHSHSSGLDETLTSVGPLDDTDLSVDGTVHQPQSPATVKVADAQPFAHKYWQSVASIGHDVASALEYAHEHGTLHRDIKPSNLLLDSDGEISVADFGLAKSIGQDDLSRTGDIVGTLRYMAPEQFTGNADARSDVYSLGVTLYELVTLHPAYNESERAKSLIHGNAILPIRPRQIRRDIPPDLETIILKAIHIEPASRYQTADALATDLRRFCEDRPILARRTSSTERLWRWSRRNPAIASLCAIAAALLVGIAGISTAASYKTNQARQAADQSREAADRTAQHAFDALDRIFDRLAPLPTIGADTFASDASDEDAVEAFIETASPPVLTKESAALLDEMLLFYDKLAAEGNEDARYRERLAEANRRIGDIRGRLGQYELAEAAYRKSLDLYVAFDDSEKTSGVVATIAAIHNQLGKSMRRPQPSRQREVDSAAEFRTAQELLEPIAGAGSAPEIRYELANTYYLQGMKPPGFRGVRPHNGPGRPEHDRARPDRQGRDQGRGDRSERDRHSWDRHHWDRHNWDQQHRLQQESLAKAIDLLQVLVADHPDRPDYQGLLAMSYMESTKDREIANSTEGQLLRTEAVELLTGLVKRFPNNPDYRFALVAAYSMGRPDSRDLSKADLDSYIERLQTAERLLAELRRDHPSVPQYLSEQLRLFQHIGTLYQRQDELDHALNVYRNAAEAFTRSSADAKTHDAVMAAMQVYEPLIRLLVEESRRSDKQKEELLREALANLDAIATLLDQQDIANLDSRRTVIRIRVHQKIIDLAKELGDQELVNLAAERMNELLPNDVQRAR